MRYPSTFAEIHALKPPPSEKEREFLAKCKAGEPCELGSDRPDGPSPDREIRAQILRYVVLGGCVENPTATPGVRLRGAWISGKLAVDFATTERPLRLSLCAFAQPVTAVKVKLPMLVLNGCHLPGLNAEGAEIAGSVFLRAIGDVPFHATGEVRLSGARIGGQLACAGGRFEAAEGHALVAHVAEVADGVFLNAMGNVPFHATGEVCLSGARIGGQFACDGVRFENAEGDALNAQDIKAVDLVWRNVEASAGVYRFVGAHVGELFDDLACWPKKGLVLDGFTYDRITKVADVGARKAWLARADKRDGTFAPQPYGQLAKVLRGMGHSRDAREILFERERLQRVELRKAAGRWWPLLGIWHFVERSVAGFGLKPFRSLWWFLGLWAVAAFLAWATWEAGEMAPNAGPLLALPEWQAAFRLDNPPKVWAATPVGTSWEKFSPVFYGFDVVVPLIDVGQTSAWGPMVDDAKPWRWGYALWVGQWVLGVMGWVVALVATAGLSGALSSQKD